MAISEQSAVFQKLETREKLLTVEFYTPRVLPLIFKIHFQTPEQTENLLFHSDLTIITEFKREVKLCNNIEHVLWSVLFFVGKKEKRKNGLVTR